MFLLAIIGSVTALVVLSAWYLFSFQGGTGTMTGVMGQMMGNQNLGGMAVGMPFYVWGAIVATLVILVTGVGWLAYYLAVPEIRGTSGETGGEPLPRDGVETWSTILRTSNTEERKVLEALARHGGSYLQKFIVKESGLSRLKTHRILSRFAERGIVVASKSGNTNEIRLAEWLTPEIHTVVQK